ncbi:MAG: substrate-binding domain-containing protein [Eubacterium sp.]|jgi:ABC-type sugar transport system, periplasmic component|nr:substrate-binding domain-containing protein [Eubacterium sp.]
MGKNLRKLVSIGIISAMMAAGLAGCGSNTAESGKEPAAGNENVSASESAGAALEEAGSSNEGAETAGGSAGAAKDGLSFAGDIVGQGGVALDIFVSEMEYDFEGLGSDFQIYNDNFTADTQMQNMETMASKGYDGIMVYGWNATSLNSISSTFATAQIPFVIFDQIPRDEESVAAMEQNEYYVGSVGTDSYAEGVNAAQAMLDNGITKALILGGSVGDTIHDTRIEGFTKTFEEAGGKVLGAGRCTDPSEATTKFDDLLSANGDATGAYCLSGDYAIAAISAMGNHPEADVKLYVAGATNETIPYIKDGTIAYADSGSKLVIPIAAALLKNAAIGNVIKDEDGSAPYFNNVIPFEVTADNADRFTELFLTGHPLTAEEMQALVGENVTYQDFVEFINNYSMK